MTTKECTKCNTNKPLTEFYKKKESKDGLHSHCKQCINSYRLTRPRSKSYKESNLKYYYRNKDKWSTAKARRRAAKLNADVPWADTQAIDFVYYCRDVVNAVYGGDCEVDHIYPLQGKTVCGLHVHNNLQLLSAKANRSKGNNCEL